MLTVWVRYSGCVSPVNMITECVCVYVSCMSTMASKRFILHVHDVSVESMGT